MKKNKQLQKKIMKIIKDCNDLENFIIKDISKVHNIPIEELLLITENNDFITKELENIEIFQNEKSIIQHQ